MLSAEKEKEKPFPLKSISGKKDGKSLSGFEFVLTLNVNILNK